MRPSHRFNRKNATVAFFFATPYIDDMTAEEIRAWRAARQLSRPALAALLGVSVSRLVDYERGESRSAGRSAQIPRVVELALEALAARGHAEPARDGGTPAE